MTRVSLSTKVIVLVALPLLVQIGLLMRIASLQGEAESALKASNHSRRMSETLSALSNQVYDFATMFSGEASLATLPPGTTFMQEKIDTGKKLFSELEQLVKDEPRLKNKLGDAKGALLESLSIAAQLKDSRDATGDAGKQSRAPLWKHLSELQKKLLKSSIVTLEQEQEHISDHGPEIQAALREETQQLMILGGLLSALLTVIAAVYLTRSITNRLKILNENTQKLAIDAPLHAPMSGSDEISQLDHFFHDMADDLKSAARLKQEVVAMVTHDLKTPLTTIQNILSTMEDGTITEAKKAQYLGMAKRNTARMVELIADLLDLERARAGMLELKCESTKLQTCFDVARDAVAASAEEAGVVLEFETSDLVVVCEPDYLARIITNLAGNAVKFSKRDSKVLVGAKREGSFAQVSVHDFGDGIPAAELEHIFERFRQAKERKNNAQGGSGLGLAICKTFVELQGGRISVESTVGEGSTFSFTVPLG